MNQYLKNIQDLLQQNTTVSDADKEALLKSITDADKQWAITDFKLDRTEKVKKTTAILLEETIEELEQKRKAVEAQNRELEIESSLERVRSVAMGMKKPGDLLNICEILFNELRVLGFTELRNALIHTFVDEQNYFTDYDYSDFTGGCVSRIPYSGHPVIENFIKQIRKANNSFTEFIVTGKELEDWKEFRRSNGEAEDPRLEAISSLYYYNYSVGPAGIGISTFSAVSETKRELLKRFRNVFEFAYRRYTDVAKAEAQAREAMIEASLERVRAAAMSMRKSEEVITVCEAMYKELTVLGFTNIRNAQIAIKNDAKESYSISLYSDHESLTMQEAPYKSLPLVTEIYNELGRSSDAFYQKEFSGKKFEDWRKWRENLSPLKDSREATASSLCFYLYAIGNGHLGISTFNAVSDEQVEIIKRFRNVFELSYQRFTDITRAEAQAREAKIELAMERVRARTMAMQKSDELAETAVLLFHQLMSLGLDLRGCGFNIWEKDEKTCTAWMSGPEGTLSPAFNLPLTEDPFFIRYYESRQNGEDFWVYETGKEELVARYEYLRTLPVLGELLAREQNDGIKIELPAFVVDHVVNFSNGNLIFVTYKHHPDEWDIFKRFGKVFEQTYTRFLDLQKAEEQAREAQIEASLERVRSKTMAMHNSNDVGETVIAMFAEFRLLGIHTNRCGILIFIDENSSEVWTARSNPDGKASLIMGKLILNSHDLLRSVYKAWKAKTSFYKYDLLGDDLVSYYEAINRSEFYRTRFDMNALPSKEYHSDFFFTEGAVFAFTSEPIAEEQTKIIKRFAGVFGQTYRRYLDLQKAEAQAREAQIEVALERTRTQSMIMQHSKELDDTLRVFHEQVLLLGIHSAFSFLWLPDEKNDRHIFWAAWGEGKNGLTVFKSKAINYPLDRNEPATAQCFVDWKGNEPVVSYHVLPAGVESYFAAWQELIDGVEQLKPEYFSGGLYYVEAFMKYGCFGVMVATDLPEEEKKILGRFAIEFERTYTRFLDLQKAEAQAREAQIEAALERVRSRTMAMQKSEELTETSFVLFQQFKNLGETGEQISIGIFKEDENIMELYSTLYGSQWKEVAKVDLNEAVVMKKIHVAWKEQKKSLVINLAGNDLREYNAYRKKLSNLEYKEDRWVIHTAFFSKGVLTFSTTEPQPHETIQLLERFAQVFDQTYTRFNDLKQAEAQALETIKRASVDRIRAEIASMRTTNDLEKITPLVWNELKTLGVPFIRCGVFIMDEEQQLVHTFLSTPEGKAIATLHVPYEFNLSIITNGVDHWRRKKIYQEYWDATTFTKAWITLSSLRETSGDSHQHEQPPENLHLHMLPFVQGMLYVGNDTPLNEVELQLVQNLADAFSTAYARYEDFNKLESANIKIERTLVDLRQAQAQLVQSEKMASLGELTAGIAHEIQNPLNFVNNFSDVNTELIEELKGEWEKLNGEKVSGLAEELFTDIVENEKKINHHGKRADAIVKGMLQHSRSSGNVREPADINVLADEYLRLAYHGLRARDKAFNATLKTDYDETIGKINIIPQDIGRVILNIITNAFYAVNEKKKQQTDYEPVVAIKTLKTQHAGGELGVEIRIADNGNGVPQKVVDKIFQPFFTTKPTGQGTGLGLSLAYDIVKAHGGELKVETKEGEGTEFIISLPVV